MYSIFFLYIISFSVWGRRRTHIDIEKAVPPVSGPGICDYHAMKVQMHELIMHDAQGLIPFLKVFQLPL